MNVPLSLSIALVLFSCYGNVTSDNEEETTPFSYSESTTPDYDYDYNSTFEYYYVTNNGSTDSNESLPESTTPSYAETETSSEMVNVRQISSESNNSICRSITDRSLLISSLLLSLAALFH